MKFAAILVCAGLSVMGVPAVFAQAASSATTEPGGPARPHSHGTVGEPHAGQNQNQFFHAQQIIGTEAQNTQGDNLGKIHDVIFNPRSGQAFAAIDVGGGRYAIVPWPALTVTQKGNNTGWWGGGNNEEVVINTTQQALKGGPSLTGQEVSPQLSNPQFLQSVYAYYNVPNPARGMAGAPQFGHPSAGTAAPGTAGAGAGTGESTSQPK